MGFRHYIVRGYTAFSERDNYEQGCLPSTAIHESMTPLDFEMRAESLDALIDKLVGHLAADHKDVLLNSCDENGRLDIQCLQREAFRCHKPSAATMEKFKRCELDLWATTYTFMVEMVEEEIDLMAHVSDMSKYSES